jgi:hypothetical protein
MPGKKNFKRPKTFKYVAPNFTLTKDGLIKLSNFDAVVNSFIRSAKFNLENALGFEADARAIKDELRVFIDKQGFPDNFSDEFVDSGVLGKLYFMCNRAAIEKAKLGKYKADTDVIPKFSLTADNCIRLTNFNALVGALAAIAAFEIDDAEQYVVSPKTVVQQLKSDVKPAKAAGQRGRICFLNLLLFESTAFKNLYIRICRAAIAKVK